MPTTPFIDLPIYIEEEDKQQLEKENRMLLRYLDNGLPLTPKLMENLKAAMRTVLWKQTDFEALWEKSEYEKIVLHLQYDDHTLLNLPWRLAVEARPFLYLTKSIKALQSAPVFQPFASPLKILVMVSAPDDGKMSGRLSYEEEEFQIIQSFEKLYASNQIEIEFANDGSLEHLSKKLQENQYHILHFSGHGVYKNGNGFLYLEEERSAKGRYVSGKEFAQTLIESSNMPSLIVLASCETAQGSTTPELEGIADELLKAKVPAVIAMSFSVSDKFASIFSAEFYKNIANKVDVPQAFYTAIKVMRAQEEQKRLLGSSQLKPSQWMIPQLYINQPINSLVNWTKPANSLTFQTLKHVLGEEKDRLVKNRHKNYRFLGRRRERKKAFEAIFTDRPEPILLEGQGGVGKTAMAEHLIERLIIQQSATYPFFFNETISGVPDMVQRLIDFFETEMDDIFIADEVEENDRDKDSQQQFKYLIQKLIKNKKINPVFVFDNLEKFQDLATRNFLPQYHDILEAIQLCCKIKRFPVICTGRYSIPEIPKITVINLNQVGLNDFYQKCRQLELSALQNQLNASTDPKQVLTYPQVITLLYQTFGGNYRRLEFFDTLYIKKKNGIYKTLQQLEDLQKALADEKAEMLQNASQDWLFEELLGLVSEEGKKALAILKHFRLPVLPLALRQQGANKSIKNTLAQLLDLTLIEKHIEPFSNRELVYYYMTPLVRDLLPYSFNDFNEGKAGKYYEYIQESINLNATTIAVEEAFYHYMKGNIKPKVNEIGGILCKFYYEIQLFKKSLAYGKQTEALLGKDTNGQILNNLGIIFQLFGKLGLALQYFERLLEDYKRKNDRQGEGTTLNNLATTAHALGDYEKALKYLELSLKIAQDIGDRQGEGATLNNLATTAYALGDYEKALKYLELSLKITQDIGDRKGEGATLNNISQIYHALGDYEKALKYLELSLKIKQDIGDRKGEGTTLNNLATTAHTLGDYEKALKYLELSLKITQDIGDRQGESYTLHNIAFIYLEQFQDVEKFMSYEIKAYQIALAIKDAKGIVGVGNELGTILCMVGLPQNGLPILHRSYEIAAKSGMPIAAEIYQTIQEYK